MKLPGIISLLIIGITSYPLVVQGEPIVLLNRAVDSKETTSEEEPNLPVDDAPNGRRQGGTGRDGCLALNTPLTALVPGIDKTIRNPQNGNLINTISKSFLVSTIAEYPSFWFYIPDLPVNKRFGEFIWQNEQDEEIHRMPLTLPEKQGVIGVSLPKNSQYALQIGKRYHWYFKIYCGNPESTTENYYVDGWVQRVAITPTDANSIWFNTLTHLAEERLNNPQDTTLKQDWFNLLKSFGLEDIEQAPIVQYYGE